VNNTIEGSGKTGLQLEITHDANVYENVLRRNGHIDESRFRVPDRSQKGGVWIASSQDIRIHENRILWNRRSGVIPTNQASDRPRLANVKIGPDNVFRGAGPRNCGEQGVSCFGNERGR
jgi:hypothetical protein